MPTYDSETHHTPEGSTEAIVFWSPVHWQPTSWTHGVTDSTTGPPKRAPCLFLSSRTTAWPRPSLCNQAGRILIEWKSIYAAWQLSPSPAQNELALMKTSHNVTETQKERTRTNLLAISTVPGNPHNFESRLASRLANRMHAGGRQSCHGLLQESDLRLRNARNFAFLV